MTLKDVEYVWHDKKKNKYFYSTSPYGEYGREIDYTEFCIKKLQGAEGPEIVITYVPNRGTVTWVYRPIISSSNAYSTT